MQTKEREREIAREAVDDAIHRMIEAGFQRKEIQDECDYIIECAEEDGSLPS